MENLTTLKSLINPGDYMINIDLTDAYLSVPIHQESQKLLRFIWQNKSYQFKAMPFGLNVAPRVFTKLLKPVVAWLRGQGIRLIIYLDDILIMASSVEMVKQHKQITIHLLGKVICLKLDNTTAVAYLNNMGGTHCPQLLRLTLEIWEWCEKKSLFLLAQHIPGVNNTTADVESRTTRDWNDWKRSQRWSAH